jgi:eukaryotic-like serine/threonine-protein kinase
VVGELIAGRYELEELVGTGGMSSVYRAHDRILDRNVARKILHERYSSDAEYVERFRHEARAVAQLEHPNIVRVIELGAEDGRQFIVFEYVDGENAKELIGRRGPLPVRDALQIALQAAQALAFAHKQGLVHRDVKPQNVLLNSDGRTRVTDFGIARELDVEVGLTESGTVLGTASYIAPEQARGERVDALTDVYSLGAVLFELLTGEVPFDGESFVAVAMRHVNEPPPSAVEGRPDVPLRVDAAVRKAMAKRREDRFGSMDAFAGELRACLAELGPGDDAEVTLITHGDPVLREAPKRVRRSRRRRTLLLILLAAALIGGAIAAVFLLFPRSSHHGHGTTSATVATAPVRLRAIAAYDPPSDGGDGQEHNSDVPKATDGNQATAWSTEHYLTPFTKPGVGIVLDAGRPASPRQIIVTTAAPGYTAEIRAGTVRSGPFHAVSASEVVGAATSFPIRAGTVARYFLVWITKLADGQQQALVNEVRARPGPVRTAALPAPPAPSRLSTSVAPVARGAPARVRSGDRAAHGKGHQKRRKGPHRHSSP